MAYYGPGSGNLPPSHVNQPGAKMNHYPNHTGPGPYANGAYQEPQPSGQYGYYAPTSAPGYSQNYPVQYPGGTPFQGGGTNQHVTGSYHPNTMQMYNQPQNTGYAEQPTVGPSSREEPTRILRRPFDPKVNDANIPYDPRFPTSTGEFPSHGVQTQQPGQPFVNLQTTLPPPVSTPSRPEMEWIQPPSMLNRPSTNTSNSNTSQTQESKVRVMTGLVTQIQPGGFGMISEEIFFQQSTVTGDMPKVGDKVVVEAEAVQGMPFKYNAKKVTKLDADLVRDEREPPRSTAGFGASPDLPESLNLSKLQTPPLKSILKRNPPPPPIISKSGLTLREDLASKASSYKPKTLVESDVLDFFDNSKNSQFPTIEFPEFTYVTDNMLNLNFKKDFPEHSKNRSKSPMWEKRDSKLDKNKRSSRQSESPYQSSPPDERRDIFSMQGLLSPDPRHGKSSNPTRPSRHQETSRNVRSRSPSPLYLHRNSSSTLPSTRRSRSPTPTRERSRRRSSSPKRRTRKHSYSKSRSRSRSVSSHRKHTRTSRSRSRERRRSLSRDQGRHRSRSTSRSPPRKSYRRKSRSLSPAANHTRTAPARSRSRSRSGSPKRHRNKDKHSSNSKSKTHKKSKKTSRRSRSSSSSVRSVHNSPVSKSPRKSSMEAITSTHGIAIKQGKSNLFNNLVDNEYGSNSSKRVDPIQPKKAPVPVRFQISNPGASKPAGPSYVPNPSFIPTSQSQLTHTAYPTEADSKKKKQKEQEPAFRVIPKKQESLIRIIPKPQEPTFRVLQKEQQGSFRLFPKEVQKPNEPIVTLTKPNIHDPKFEKIEAKIKQWEKERQEKLSAPPPQQPKAKKETNSEETLLKNPEHILQLKQTILSDLEELRIKGQSEAGKTLLKNPVNIAALKQTVQRDLNSLRDKVVDTPRRKSEEKEYSKPQGKTGANAPPVIDIDIAVLKNSVEEGLKELRTKFQTKEEDKVPRKSEETPAKQPQLQQHREKPQVPKEATTSKRRSKSPPIKRSEPRFRPESSTGRPTAGPFTPRVEEYNEELERIQEDIHQQRFQEEEHRLKSMGDGPGLDQLYFMEKRRRRRLEERHLSRIRNREIQLKKEKNFVELNRLREEWGPPRERLTQEKLLRDQRIMEEQQEAQYAGQSEAIRRHESEYQSWLEDEAVARLHEMRNAERANRGVEVIKRRRTPSPRQQHPGRSFGDGLRRRSRSPSYERYREDWRMRPPRERSPEMDYDTFVMRYMKGPPPPHFQMHPGDDMRSNFPPDFANQHFPESPLDHDRFIISRAMDDVARRQDEIMQREMEIQRRMEITERRFPSHDPRMANNGPSDPRLRNRDREYQRFAVPRR